ncbi:DUF58 domain-containing protein [Clostridium rectalis]|uniref:DUF58 domain-containing protein n=1 Tax=Clostridium rectalis TaxID=2040295 RepID=UPI000F642A4A|nr:DUF58 domain-containing protein [Clostridium rectalis]
MIDINRTFIFFIVISFLYAYLIGGILAYSILYTLLFMFIISYIYIIIIKDKIYIEVKFEREVGTTGDEIKVVTTIKNGSVLPIYYVQIKNKILYSMDEKYNGYLMDLKPKSSKSFESKVKFNIRGIYDFGNLYMCAKGILSLIIIKRNVKKNIDFYVYPKVHALTNVFMLNGYTDDLAICKVGDGIDSYSISDIRKYRPGDDLRRIHWKVSAKYGGLHTKNFDKVSSDKYIILLDMKYIENYKEDKFIEEHLIEMTISLVKFIKSRNGTIDIYINNNKEEHFFIDRESKIQLLMNYFIENKSKGKNDFNVFILNKIKEIPSNSSILIFTPKINDEIRKNFINIKKMGYKFVVFYSSENPKYYENIILMKNYQIYCIGKDIL